MVKKDKNKPADSIPVMSKWRWLVWLLLLAWLSVWAVRATAPADFWSGGQARAAWHVQDMVFNGNAACQTDQDGVRWLEPPLYTWLAALCSAPTHRPTLAGLQFPGALAYLACALMLWFVGRWRFGVWAGFFSAFFFLVSPLAANGVLTACGDSLNMLLAAGATLAAYRAWRDGGGASWLAFWSLAVLAVLAGGLSGLLPLVVLAGGARVTRWKTAEPPAPVDSDQEVSVAGMVSQPSAVAWLSGLLLFLAACGAWLSAAANASGDATVEQALLEGLFGWDRLAATAAGGGWADSLRPAAVLAAGFAPWCLLTLAGLWSVFRHPATTGAERRFEQFLAWYLALGMVLAMLFPHARAEQAAALVVPASLLAGRQAARWAGRRQMTPHRLLTAAGVLLAVFLAGTAFQFHFLKRNDAAVLQTRALREMADEYGRKVGLGRQNVIYAADVPAAFQFFRGSMRRSMPVGDVVEKLSGPVPVVAVVGDVEAVRAAVEKRGGACREVVAWPEPRTLPGKRGAPGGTIVQMGILTNQLSERPGREPLFGD